MYARRPAPNHRPRGFPKGTHPAMSALEPTASPFLVPFDASFEIENTPTHPGKKAADPKACRKALEERVEELHEYQRLFFADDRYSMLLVFQAMDAAGKDSTIRAVFSGVNPAGFQVSSFKRPSSEEIDHDFLWRSARRLPERGRIGVFNRSYYEASVCPTGIATEHFGPIATPRSETTRNTWPTTAR